MGGAAIRGAAGLSLLLTPILLIQGLRVRRSTPRLPEALGPRWGSCDGASPPLRLLLVGDSTAAGVGAPDLSAALAGQLPRALSDLTGRAVAWQMLGRTGATARSARAMLPEAELELEPGVVVLALGVNDVLRMRGVNAWRRDLGALIAAVRDRAGPVPVVIAGVPPVGRFPVLPQPLRGVLGMRAELLDSTARTLARNLDAVHHAPIPEMPPGTEQGFFCADGLHPSPHGYACWAAALAATVASACVAPSE